MKQLFTRIIILALVMGGFFTSASAQRRGRAYSHHSSRPTSRGVDRAFRGLRNIETAADYVMLGSLLSSIDDYTGLRIGYNSASLKASGFDDATTESIPAFNLGIVFGWYLGNSNISVEPGLYYSMKGGRLRERFDGYTESSKYTMHSFEVPAVMKFHLPIAPAVEFDPFAGVFMSFGFDGTTTIDGGGKYDTFEDRYLEDFDAGFRLGAGLSIANSYFEVAYDLGLVNLCDSYEFGSRNALRSRTWSFNIGFNF